MNETGALSQGIHDMVVFPQTASLCYSAVLLGLETGRGGWLGSAIGTSDVVGVKGTLSPGTGLQVSKGEKSQHWGLKDMRRSRKLPLRTANRKSAV